MEIGFMKKKDQDQKRLKFTDIESEQYDPSDPANGGITYEEAMLKLTAITQSGERLFGVQAIHAAYTEINLGWLYSFTKLPLIGPAVDRVYNYWAYYRTLVTRGESITDIFEKRNAAIQCTSERCKVEKVN